MKPFDPTDPVAVLDLLTEGAEHTTGTHIIHLMEQAFPGHKMRINSYPRLIEGGHHEPYERARRYTARFDNAVAGSGDSLDKAVRLAAISRLQNDERTGVPRLDAPEAE